MKKNSKSYTSAKDNFRPISLYNDVDNSLEKKFHILWHPERRKILESLLDKDRTFIELSEFCKGNHGKLGYHLRWMKDLIERNPDGVTYSVTSEGKVVYKIYLQTSHELKKQRLDLPTSPQSNPMRYAEKLSLGDHAILFHEDEDTLQSIVFPFIRVGLLRNLAVIYLTSEKRLDYAVNDLEKNDIHAQDLERKGSFTIISSEDWFLHRGKGSADVTITNWMKLVKEKKGRGYDGLQVIVEVNNIPDSKIFDTISYEKKLGRTISDMACGLCVYDTKKVTGEQFEQLMQMHGHSLFQGIAFQLI